MFNMPGYNILGLAGYSGSGKTTLLEKLIPLLVNYGLRVAVIKHTHHDFDIDQPGKDSYRQRQAGAGQVMITSTRRCVLMQELRDQAEPTLQECCARLAPCDLVLVEGYKQADIPKLEVHRSATLHPYLYTIDPRIIAIVTDQQITLQLPLPVLDINAPQAVAEFIINHYALTDSDSSLKVIQGGKSEKLLAGHPDKATKTVQVVRLGAEDEANTVALIKWNRNETA